MLSFNPTCPQHWPDCCFPCLWHVGLDLGFKVHQMASSGVHLIALGLTSAQHDRPIGANLGQCNSAHVGPLHRKLDPSWAKPGPILRTAKLRTNAPKLHHVWAQLGSSWVQVGPNWLEFAQVTPWLGPSGLLLGPT